MLQDASKQTGMGISILSHCVCITTTEALSSEGCLDLLQREANPAMPRPEDVDHSRSHNSFPNLKNLIEQGKLHEALTIVNTMYNLGVYIPPSIFFTLLQGCIDKLDSIAGREVYMLILGTGSEADAFLSSHLIRLFALTGCVDEASRVFSRVSTQTVFTWCAIIDAHTKAGQCKHAIRLYKAMHETGVKADAHTFVAVLKACADSADLISGQLIHDDIVEAGFEIHSFVGNSLIDMYSKCGSIEDAGIYFDRLPIRDIVTWNTMIAGYMQHGLCHDAFQLFQQMQVDSIEPDHFTWATIIAGFTQCGLVKEAHDLLHQMQLRGIDLDPVLIVSVLKAISTVASLEQGRSIHYGVIRNGVEANMFIGSTLINMYAKCGSLKDACVVFERLPERDMVTWSAMTAAFTEFGYCEKALGIFSQMQEAGLVDKVTWNALIDGFVEHGNAQEALQLFDRMQFDGIEPDKASYVSVLKACSSLGALQLGTSIHKLVVEKGYELNETVGNTLVDMYAKLGFFEDASLVFNRLSTRSVVTWSAMIAGYGKHGKYKAALQIYKDMLGQGLKPNDVVFLCLLSACCHAKLVSEGYHYVKCMLIEFGIDPTVEHFNCLVGLLGKIGHLKDAEDALETIHFQCNMVGWESLLYHSGLYHNIELGKRCFNYVVSVNRTHASGYALMSKLFTDTGMTEFADNVENERLSAGAHKKPGQAYIEAGNKVHTFIVGDRTHSQSDDIYAKLKLLSVKLKEHGLVQASKSAESKEAVLAAHSVKLALAFGLINIPQDATIRISKNLRMCTDCHAFVKMVSKIEKRNIIISDSSCTHHCRDGLCCCEDYL